MNNKDYISDKYIYKEINNNNNIPITYNNGDYMKYNDPEKYNNYIKINSFSSLFRKPGRLSNTPQIPQSQQQNTQKPVQQPTQQVTKPVTQQDTIQQGRAYDAGAMWSPVSWAGVVYEWNRGVIGISVDGEVVKEKLDGTINHHADATIRIAEELGSPIEDTTAPFEAAINCNKNGLLIFQSEGDNAFVYFPDEISEEQLSELKNIIAPRGEFSFSFTHKENIYEEQKASDVIAFATKICSLEKTGAKRA